MLVPEWIAQVAEGMILLLVGVGVRVLFSIQAEIRRTNGRLMALETSTVAHEKYDNERFEQLRYEVRHGRPAR